MSEIREAMIEAGYYDGLDVEESEVELGEPSSEGPDSCPICGVGLNQGRVPQHIRDFHD